MKKYKKEELEKMVLVDNLSYKSIGDMYGVTGVYIRKICLKIGIEIPERAKRSKENRTYSRKKYFCENCKKEIGVRLNKPKFCDLKCSSEYTRRKTLAHWLENQEGFSNKVTPLKWLKPYLLGQQEHKCKICGIKDEWNGNPMVFIMDHIDGNAANNTKENLRLICHNCDSQLPTYKSKNKGSARTKRYN
jgi:hypothetical protein